MNARCVQPLLCLLAVFVSHHSAAEPQPQPAAAEPQYPANLPSLHFPPEREWPRLLVRGISKQGDKYLAIVEGLGLVEAGETLRVLNNYQVFVFEIVTISEKGMLTKPLGAYLPKPRPPSTDEARSKIETEDRRPQTAEEAAKGARLLLGMGRLAKDRMGYPKVVVILPDDSRIEGATKLFRAIVSISDDEKIVILRGYRRLRVGEEYSFGHDGTTYHWRVESIRSRTITLRAIGQSPWKQHKAAEQTKPSGPDWPELRFQGIVKMGDKYMALAKGMGYVETGEEIRVRKGDRIYIWEITEVTPDAVRIKKLKSRPVTHYGHTVP